jgi:hypothetical protein
MSYRTLPGLSPPSVCPTPLKVRRDSIAVRISSSARFFDIQSITMGPGFAGNI